MANFTFILTIFLITFSFATFSIAQSENDDLALDIATKGDNKETSTTVGFSEIFPENVETKTNDVSEMPLDRPMKIIRLHPITRRIPRCRHGGMGEKPMRPRQMSLGDDMMVPSGENGDFDTMVHVVGHRHRHHHHHGGMPRFPMGKHHDFFANKRFGEDREEGFPRERDHGSFAKQRFAEERDEEREERPDGGFMRSVRKFLMNSGF